MDASSNRSARLTTAERKRLTDRKAQRQRRERIKSYIARLEKTLEDLTAASGDGMEAALLKQLEQQRLKTERLTNVINHIREVLEETQSPTTQAPGSSSSPPSPLIPSREGHAPSSSNVTQGSKNEAQEQRQLQLQPQVQPQPQQPFNTNGSARWIISTDLTREISLNSQNPSNSGTRNYFDVINESISKISQEKNSILPSTPAEDDDLAIRAVLFGWDSVYSQGQTLDRVWGLLQALDQGIFSRTGLVERVAIIRLMRSMLRWNLNPLDHTQRPIPSFMFPTMTQTMIPHAPLVDYFAWPNLRDYLIVSGTTCITENTAAHYVAQIRLKWPYELRDICKYHVSEGKYRFSGEFDNVYYDLHSWTVASLPMQMLIENGPSLTGGLDMHANSVNTAAGDAGNGEGGAGNMWDHLLQGSGQAQG